MEEISIAKIVGAGICVSAPDGHKVHDEIRAGLLAGKRVRLSFKNVTRITTAFLNAAVGQLYGEFDEATLRNQLAPPADATGRQLTQLKLVVDRAKAYFRDPEGSRASFRAITGLSDD
jgi:hypothetical protein